MRNTSSYVVARRAADRKESKRNRRYSGGGGRQDASLGWVEKVRGGCEVAATGSVAEAKRGTGNMTGAGKGEEGWANANIKSNISGAVRAAGSLTRARCPGSPLSIYFLI